MKGSATKTARVSRLMSDAGRSPAWPPSLSGRLWWRCWQRLYRNRCTGFWRGVSERRGYIFFLNRRFLQRFQAGPHKTAGQDLAWLFFSSPWDPCHTDPDNENSRAGHPQYSIMLESKVLMLKPTSMLQGSRGFQRSLDTGTFSNVKSTRNSPKTEFSGVWPW